MPAVAASSVLPRRLLSLALSLLSLCAMVGLPSARAFAADDVAAPGTPVEIALKSGKPLTGVVESADAKEVVVRVGKDDVRRLAWALLAPAGAFTARSALTKADDGPGRLVLAELASELGLWAQARVEYEKALALKAIEAKVYEKAVADAEKRAIETGIARAERAADDGDIPAALEIARGLKLDFSGAVDGKKVDDLVAALETRIHAREAEQNEAKTELDKAVVDADRKRDVLARATEAKMQIGLGDRSADDARADMPKGKITRVRKATEAGDASYVAARRALGRLRHVLRRDEPEKEQVQALLTVVDRNQYRLLFDAAKFFWDARVFASAEEFAARASYLDPVDPALLELRTEIRANRIRYRVSEVSNAYPR